MSNFHSSRLVTARKPHRCAATGAWIAKGTKYHRVSGSFEGDFYSYAVHEVVMLHLQKAVEASCQGVCYSEFGPDDFLEDTYQRMPVTQAAAEAIENLSGLWWSPLRRWQEMKAEDEGGAQ